MNLREISYKTEYRTGKSNVIKDFFIPVLSQAVLYRRAVGFFSSTALIQISKGIAELVKNGGKIQIIASPRLSEEDISAMQIGYKTREEVVENALLRSMAEPQSYFECERLNLLATLIANGKLDIKIAFTESCNQIGIYHEKMGLVYDENNNIVAFSGSTNETEMAFIANYEVMDIYCSWQSEFEVKKVEEKEFAFHLLWTNADSSVDIIDFPKVVKDKLLSYKKDEVNYLIDEQENFEQSNIEEIPKNVFRVPKYIDFYDYQVQAIESWMAHDCRGIFDMATGSGKTYTGLGALSKLSIKLKDKLGVFIICPYQHLVEQWIEDINNFNVSPLICYSAYDWKRNFKALMGDFKLGVAKNFCVIMTNATFSMDYVQDEVDKLKGNLCIVVDEAHNFGATKQLLCMKDNFKYRLALSATLERHHDEIGTQKLKDYFGEKCIEFSLKEAIDRDFLTHYYYHPIPITLDEDEMEEYSKLTERIINILRKCKSTKGDAMPKSVEILLIKRARVIAGARNKLKALYEIMQKYKDDNNILVYCGATKVVNGNYIEDSLDDDEEKRQIEIVTDMLGNKLNMKVSMFTAKEKADERERIKKSFSEGEMLQALVAIKCLDEGVNIPGIRTAFILASSTNSKEYIQRRGRVLRKAKNKPYAVIYDFITLPRSLDNSSEPTNVNCELSLIKRERERMEDFASICENPSETIKLFDMIDEIYSLNYIGGEDYGI